MQHALIMQILHPLRDLMHAPQHIHLVPTPHTPQPRDQTPVLAIRTNEEPRRLPDRAARSEELQDIGVVQVFPDGNFVREQLARGRGREDLNSYRAFAPSALVHGGKIAYPDFADFLVEVDFVSAIIYQKPKHRREGGGTKHKPTW